MISQLKYLIAIILLLPFVAEAQNNPSTITVGDGSYASHDIPFNNYYWHSWNQEIYPASDISQSGYITSIAYNCASEDTITFDNLRIYMGVTSNTEVETENDWLPMDSLTLVYFANNILMGTHTGWTSFTLGTPFYYDASQGNLVVVVAKSTAYGYSYNLQWYATELYDTEDYEVYATLFRENDGDEDYAEHPGDEWGYRTNVRANIQLTIQSTIDNICVAPSVTAGPITATTAEVHWTPSGDEDAWELAYGPRGFNIMTEGTHVTLSDTTYSVTGLEGNRDYDIYVRALCSEERHSQWNFRRVRTECGYIEQFPYEEDFEDYSTWNHLVPDCWSKMEGGEEDMGIIDWGHMSYGCMSLSSWEDTVDVVALPLMRSIDTLQISFYAQIDSGVQLQVGVMEGDTFHLVQDVTTQAGIEEYSLQSIVVSFADYHGRGDRIAFRALFDNNYKSVYIDEVVVDGNSSYIGSHTYTVSWNDFDYNMGYISVFEEGTDRYVTNGAIVDSNTTLRMHIGCNEGVFLNTLTCNGTSLLPHPIHTDTTLYIQADSNLNFYLEFAAYLPDLHVTALSHSPMIAGQTATISWTVRNDGLAPTPNGELWYDRLWLSVECRVAANDDNPVLLGEFACERVLDTGDYYTQTQSVVIPEGLSGTYYLFAITDAYDAHTILWDEDTAVVPYRPDPYLGAYAAHCIGANCGDGAGNRILEMSEISNGSSYHDNFFYDTVGVGVPPAADFQIASVIAPSDCYSGTEQQVLATIQNLGQCTSGERIDALFLSPHDTFDSLAVMVGMAKRTYWVPYVPMGPYDHPDTIIISGNDTLEYHILSDPVYPPLAVGETCLDTLYATIPYEMYGTHYFYVWTNYDGRTNEYANVSNNVFRSDSVHIQLTPPADLVPADLSFPTAVSTGEALPYSFSIVNQGAGEPNIIDWINNVFLTRSPAELEDVMVIGTHPYSGLTYGTFGPEASHTFRDSVVFSSSNNIPAGEYYLYVDVDAHDDVFEYLYEDNNLMQYTHTLTVTNPDLQIGQVLIDDTLMAGSSSSAVAFQLRNTGAGRVTKSGVRHSIYLTSDYNGANIVSSCDLIENLQINGNDSVMRYHYMPINPNLADGRYYLWVMADSYDRVAESDNENNRSSRQSVYVRHQQLPDLNVTSFTMPDEVQASLPAQVSFDIQNIGEVDYSATDCPIAVYALNDEDTILCPRLSQTTPSGSEVTIRIGNTLHFEQQVLVAPNISSGSHTFLLIVDKDSTFAEPSKANNHRSATSAVTSYDFDLAVTNVQTATSAQRGDTITVSWTVTNVGSVPSATVPMHVLVEDRDCLLSELGHYDEEGVTTYFDPLWSDWVYLAEGTTTLGSPLSAVDHHVVLNPNGSYTVSQSCVLPLNHYGDLDILVRTDASGTAYDNNLSNNYATAPITVQLGEVPDLQIVSLDFPAEIESNQTYRLAYTIQNVGSASTPEDQSWIDAFYLTADNTVDDNTLIGYAHFMGVLPPNATYSDTIDVFVGDIPVGDYSLIGITDKNDALFEHDGESNNQSSRDVTVRMPLPCDLKPLTPTFPTNVYAGGPVTINWSVSNIGRNVALGQVKDVVYLSSDNRWSNDDIMLGHLFDAIAVEAGSSTTRTLSTYLSGVPIGDYYVIVKCNTLNALNEMSYTNNEALSPTKIHVDCRLLAIGEQVEDSLFSSGELCYRMDVTAEDAGQTLAIRLEGDSAQLWDGLFVSYGQMPSAMSFDHVSAIPYSNLQELLIPSLQQGTYFIMARPSTLQSPTLQSTLYTLQSYIVNFEILSVNASSGSNSGYTTVAVRGAKFEPVMDFWLVKDSVRIPADQFIFHNASDVDVTFNLIDKPTGIYDLWAELPDGSTAVKTQAFSVNSGLPAGLTGRFDVQGRGKIRKNQVMPITIYYANDGDSDVEVSSLQVDCMGGEVSLQANGPYSSSIIFPAFDGADARTLRPGQTGAKVIFFRATSSKPSLTLSSVNYTE